jgi:hypothetical protein
MSLNSGASQAQFDVLQIGFEYTHLPSYVELHGRDFFETIVDRRKPFLSHWLGLHFKRHACHTVLLFGSLRLSYRYGLRCR